MDLNNANLRRGSWQKDEGKKQTLWGGSSLGKAADCFSCGIVSYSMYNRFMVYKRKMTLFKPWRIPYETRNREEWGKVVKNELTRERLGQRCIRFR